VNEVAANAMVIAKHPQHSTKAYITSHHISGVQLTFNDQLQIITCVLIEDI